jgi:phosphatidylserine decarboxylase
MIDPLEWTARVLDVLPRTQLSRLLGGVALIRAPAPVLDAAIALYVRTYGIDMSEVDIPKGGFRSFDEFFTRRLEPGARPIADDVRALVSPADGRIDGAGRLTQSARLFVKGTSYTAADLIGDATQGARYEGGSYFVVYLSPKDYHRVHAPVSGEIDEVRYTPGTLYPVNRIGTEHVPQLLVRNERVSIVQRSEIHGTVTTVLVGAMAVGRIALAFDDLQTNRGVPGGTRSYADAPIRMERGMELGMFHLGSTVVVLAPPDCCLHLDVEVGATVRVGQALGVARDVCG